MVEHKIRRNLFIIFGITIFVFYAILFWVFFVPKSSDFRIVQGRDAKPYEFPFAVSIGPRKCGGSLIHKSYVITAKHCLENMKKISIVAGENDESKFTSNGEWREVERKYTMPIHDIALLKLSNPFKINKKIKPAKLPDVNERTPDQLIATGWSSVSHNCSHEGKRILQTTVLNVEEDIDSVEFIQTKITPSIRNGICTGDEGSGLVEKLYERGYVLFGVVSLRFGELCEEFNGEDFAIKVAHIVEWIKSHMKNSKRSKLKNSTVFKT